MVLALMEVAEGLSFRSNPSHRSILTAMREKRPVRISKAALETLAIVAYRQPATKPEVDHIRGVDCGGTLKALLDRKDDPKVAQIIEGQNNILDSAMLCLARAICA